MSDNCKPSNPSQLEELFPAWSTPQDIRDRWSCESTAWQASPTRATDTLLTVLSSYFADPMNFTDPEVRKLVQDSDLEITALTHIDPTKTGKLPRIIVDFTDSKASNKRFGRDNCTSYNIHNSTASYYTEWTLQHQIIILAGAKREAILLGETVCKLFTHFREPIKEALSAAELQIAGMSGVQVLGEDAQNGFQVAVGIATHIPDTWNLVEAAARTKRIQFAIKEN